TDITGAGSTYLAATLGVSTNPVFDGGTLQLDSSGPVFSQDFTINSTNGTIDTAGLTSTLSGVLSGPGGLTFMNSGSGGRVTLSNLNTYVGSTTIDAGATVALSGNGSIASSSGVTDNGSFDISTTNAGASITTLSGTGNVTLGAQTLTLTNADDTFAGSISGTGGVSVAGGAETLSGVNTYTGATSIAGGATLALSGTGSVASSSGVAANGSFDISATTTGAAISTLSGSGTVALGSNTLTLSNASSSFAGSIGGSGGLAIAAGNETLTGINSYTGGTSIASGATLALSGNGSIASSSAVTDNGTLNIAGSNGDQSIGSLAGSGAVQLGNLNLILMNANDSFAGAIAGSGGVAVAGGTQTFTGTNSYTGVTSITSGATLALSGAGNIASSSGLVADGTLDISAATGNVAISTLYGAGTVALGNNSVTLTNAGSSFAGGIDGSGGVGVAAGSQILSGINGYTGGTSIAAGATLALSGAGSIASSSGLADDGTLDISAASSAVQITTLSGSGAVSLGNNSLTLTNANDTFAGNIAGNGGLVVGAGSESLSGVNAYSGATSIASGATLALIGAGSVASSGSVIDNGTFDVSGVSTAASISSLSGSGAVALGNNGLSLTNASGNFAGSIGGSGAVTVSGGTQTLSGTNTYSGGTTVSGGSTLVVNSDAAMGNASGALTLNNGTLQAAGTFSTARGIDLAGAATIDATPGSTLTQTGAISGNGHLLKDGDGTLVLAGDNRNWGQQGNTASGGLTIDAGLVEVTNPYGLGYGLVTLNSGVLATTVNIVTGQTIQFAGDTVLNTDADTTTTLTGIVQSEPSSDCFRKMGAGTLAIAGTATLANGTCVEQGRLSVNGVLNSIVTVDPQGTLRGIGTINGPVSVRGTLAPGNSPGTLTTTGSVTMASGSTYQEDINGTGTGYGPGNYSRLLITGSSSQFIASGATLLPNLVDITGSASYVPYVPEIGDSYRIVTADGGIVGRFAALTQPVGMAGGTRLVAFYDVNGSNSIDLRVVPVSYASYLLGRSMSRNAVSAGAAVDQILGADQAAHASAAQSQLAYVASGLSAAQLPAAMTALSGEIHAELAAAAPQAGRWVQGAIARQLMSGGNGDDASDVIPGHSFWLDSTEGHSGWSADQLASGFSIDRAQIAFGFDMLDDTPQRIGLGFSHSLTNVEGTAGSGSVEENLGFLYGQYRVLRVVVDGMYGYGGSRWDSTRADPLGFTTASLTTSPHGNDSLASIGLRWPLQVGSMTLQPYARGSWQSNYRQSFAETDVPDGLQSPSYTATGLRSMIGIIGNSGPQSPLASPFTYQFNVGLGNDSGDLAHPTMAASLAGAELAIETPDVGRIFGQASVGGTLRLGKRTYIYAGVADEVRRGTSPDTSVNAGVRTTF
ncbi:MAG: autotransporter-associated beta strand repeat-containing protein, partial [Steroidobacteraceae bacterium]